MPRAMLIIDIGVFLKPYAFSSQMTWYCLTNAFQFYWLFVMSANGHFLLLLSYSNFPCYSDLMWPFLKTKKTLRYSTIFFGIRNHNIENSLSCYKESFDVVLLVSWLHTLQVSSNFLFGSIFMTTMAMMFISFSTYTVLKNNLMLPFMFFADKSNLWRFS